MFADIPSESVILVAVVFFLAGLVQGASGFGFGIAAMSLLPHFISPKLAVTYVTVLAPLMAGHILLSLRKHANWRAMKVIYLAYLVLGLPCGLWLFGAADERLLKQIVGLALAVSCLVLWLVTGARKYVLPKWTAGVAGTLSGLLSGSANVGGPPVVVYLWLQEITKEEASATLQVYFTVCNTTRFIGMILFAVAGMHGYERVTLGNCAAALVFWPGLALGCWLGLRIFRRMNPETLRKIAYASVIVAGLVLFAKATWLSS